MIDFNGLLDVIGQTFFDGDITMAGIVVYSMCILLILAITRRTFVTLVAALPLTLIFSTLGVISTELLVLMIVVIVLGLAMTSRNIWRD